MAKKPLHRCAVVVFDRRATRKAGVVITRPCGAPTNSLISVRGDILFAACSRHDGRLKRAFRQAVLRP